jgi:Spy/CpxP family protein refolding chaperone
MRALMTAIAIVTAAGLAVAQPAAACPTCPNAGAAPMMAPGADMGMPGMQMPGMSMPCMPAMPELTNEQQDKMDVARLNHIRAMAPIQTDIQIKETELAALWRADKLDGKKIVAKVREIGALRSQAELERVNHMLAMYEILTPEQRKSFRPGMGMGRGGHKGMMRGMRGMGGKGPMMGQGQGPMGCGGDCGGNCHSD